MTDPIQPAGTMPYRLADDDRDAARSAAPSREVWPALPPMTNRLSNTATSTCATPLATMGNAQLFVDRRIPLSDALKDGVFGSSRELEHFIDDYLARTAGRPDLAALHAEAARRGPEILAHRLDVEDAEAERPSRELQLHDRIAPLQLRAPLPIQQRVAVGEVAIPVARVATFTAKFVPVAGQLVVLAEVATGRDLVGLGEKISNADRAIDAALLIAPHAAKALGAGVRGVAEMVRLTRATGRTAEEMRVLCRTALVVQKNQAAAREGIAAVQAGRALSTEQRAAMSAIGHAAEPLGEEQALRRRMYQPTVTDDVSLPAGAGSTDKYGNVTLSPHGTPQQRALADAHESVHAALSPKAMNALRDLRADIGMTAYQRSELCRYIEEALAETYAQIKVNGPRGIPDGLTFPLRNGYVTLGRVAGEAAVATIVYGGVQYAVHVTVNKK